MKKIKRGWAMFDPDDTLFRNTICSTRQDAIHDFLCFPEYHVWKYFYDKGHRCRSVTITYDDKEAK